VPKSSIEMRTPSVLSSCRVRCAASVSCMRRPSVISSSTSCGATSNCSSTPATRLLKSACWNWRVETFTDTGTSGSAACSQRLRISQTLVSTQ